MAPIPTPEQERNIKRLYEIFPQIKEKDIDLIAAECKHDLEETCKILFDMIKYNKTEILLPPPVSHVSENSGNQICKTCDRIVDLINKGYKIMIIMRGLPGSGKSYLAKMLLERGLGRVDRNEFIFNTNDYFNRSGRYCYKPSELEEAHTWNQRRVFSNVKGGVSPIIIDDANLEVSEMKVYCAMGVQFGYIIEIVEVATPWALNAEELASRNAHHINKTAIESMLGRYEQGVTLRKLLTKYNLEYKVSLPQYRRFPPIQPPLQPARLPDVAKGARKKQPPVEYVHKFQNTRRNKEVPPSKVDVDQLLDINKSSMDNKNENVIRGIDELKLTPTTEEVVQPTQCELLKQLQESKEMIAKLAALVSSKSGNIQLPSSIGNDNMEVDEPTNCELEDTSDPKSMDRLLEENKKLRDLLQVGNNQRT